MDVHTTSSGVEFVRTPDSCFENLPGWTYAPKYLEIDGLRQAYIDEGPADKDPVLLIHGQPTWSFLYRTMIPELLAGGHRVIAMDHIGMGRSDKPVDVGYHSLANHVGRLHAFISGLQLTNVTAFIQDWGATIALMLLSEKPDVFARVIVENGGIPIISKQLEISDDPKVLTMFADTIGMMPADQPYFFDEDGNSIIPMGGDMAEALGPWASFALHSETFKPSMIMQALTFREKPADVLAGYNAPFPSRVAMAAPRSFPSLFSELVGVSEPALEKLKQYTKPFLTLDGGNDPGVGPETQEWFIEHMPGAKGQNHQRYRDASHFATEDMGPELARQVSAFIEANPL